MSAGGVARPLGGAEEQRPRRRRPAPLATVAGQAEGGAELVHLPRDPILQAVQAALGECRHAVEQMVPPARAAPHIVAHHIAHAGLRHIGCKPALAP